MSTTADLGGTIICLHFYLYMSISLQAMEILHLTVLEGFLENYSYFTILAMRVLYMMEIDGENTF